MDTLKIMLGATIALLLVAVGVSYKGMNQQVRNAPEQEIRDLRRQLLEMEQESERLKLERERRILREAAAEPQPTDAVTREDAAVFAERLAQLERETEEAKAQADRAQKETDFLLDKRNENKSKDDRRVRVINDAMLIATVKEWVEDPQFGGFAILRVESEDNVQSGTVLAIRRNGGILGKLKVTELSIEGAVANPVTAFGEVKPQPGDELILDSIVQLAN
jgi:biotin carboxyl carrier protein